MRQGLNYYAQKRAHRALQPTRAMPIPDDEPEEKTKHARRKVGPQVKMQIRNRVAAYTSSKCIAGRSLVADACH